MKHECHDPFCQKRLVGNKHRKYASKTGGKRKWKSPQCTAAVQYYDHTVNGIHPWRRCRQRVGADGDKTTMRCKFHRPGAPGEFLPSWRVMSAIRDRREKGYGAGSYGIGR